MNAPKTRMQVDFDATKLNSFLAGIYGEKRELEVERIGGGQSNPTYFVSFGHERMVLRKKPAGTILPGAHAIEREFQVLSALCHTEVPVPKPILLSDDTTILGTPFYLMERVEGRVFSDCSLSNIPSSDRRDVYLGMADAMAKLHAVRPEDVGLEHYGRPGNYFVRQIARWTKQWKESPADPIPSLDQVADWLPVNVPVDEGVVSIAHGDFRLGNLLFHPIEPRVVAILDWELSTLGHPLADVGFCCIPWHTKPSEYGGIAGIDLAAQMLPTQAAFLSRYYASRRDSTLRLERFHVIFALFRFAVIFVGIADRARAGNAASDNAKDVAPLAEVFAKRALALILGARFD